MFLQKIVWNRNQCICLCFGRFKQKLWTGIDYITQIEKDSLCMTQSSRRCSKGLTNLSFNKMGPTRGAFARPGASHLAGSLPPRQVVHLGFQRSHGRQLRALLRRRNRRGQSRCVASLHVCYLEIPQFLSTSTHLPSLYARRTNVFLPSQGDSVAYRSLGELYRTRFLRVLKACV